MHKQATLNALFQAPVGIIALKWDRITQKIVETAEKIRSDNIPLSFHSTFASDAQQNIQHCHQTLKDHLTQSAMASIFKKINCYKTLIQ